MKLTTKHNEEVILKQVAFIFASFEGLENVLYIKVQWGQLNLKSLNIANVACYLN